MGFFDTLKKIVDVVAKEASQSVSADNSMSSTQNTVNSATSSKTTPADILASGSKPAKPSTKITDVFFGGEEGDEEFNVEFMLSSDFIEFNSHCEVMPAFQYEPFSNEEFTGYEENLPHIGIGPNDDIYDAVEGFEENDVLPEGDYEKCDSKYFAFKCSFDAYGLKHYAYAFRSGTTREKEILSLDYLPDICGTELEKKLRLALDEIASTYSETKA